MTAAVSVAGEQVSFETKLTCRLQQRFDRRATAARRRAQWVRSLKKVQNLSNVKKWHFYG
jgi:hypothetical protein